LEQELSKLDLEQIKAVSEKYDITCEDCETKEEYIICISDSQKVTVEEIRSQFEIDQNEGPSEEGDNMPGFENAENLLKETKVKFESGDYNATIDKATEAINAGATALNSLLGMGLSYAIKSSEKLVVDLKEMDIDASSIEHVIDNAKATLENQEFQTAGDIVTELKESIYDLSQRQGDKISQLLDATKAQIEEAKGMGANVTEAEAKLKLATDQANAGAFTQAMGSASQTETLVNTAVEARISEINELINQAETAIDEAKYVNAPVEDAQTLLEEARGAFSRQEYQLAVENANNASESANSAKNEQIQKVLSVQEKMIAVANGTTVEEPPASQEIPVEETAFEIDETPQAEEIPQVEETTFEAEEEIPAKTEKVCPKCEGEPTYVEQYKRHFCYTCNEYIEPKEKEVKVQEPKAAEAEKVCPKCQEEPTYVEQYDRHFCYTCNEYVKPEEKKAEVKKEEPKAVKTEKVCPKCEGEATYVEQYDRHFCYTCNEYVKPTEKKAEVKKAEVKQAQPVQKEAKKVCPTCKEEPTYVEQYKKYYCYTCSQYVNPTEKAENACPTCGKEATYVEQYGRNYCYDCKKYL
jgi:HEPN domain-containing protein